MLRVYYIVNGRRCSRETVEVLRRQIGLGQIHVTEYKGHATELARRAAFEGYDIVVARGGDGTVSEVINGLAPDFHPALGIDPDGSGMDFPRNLGYDVGKFNGSPEVYRRAFEEDQIRFVDLIKVGLTGGTLFCCSLFSFGFSALVVDEIDKLVVRTPKMYTQVGLRLAWGMEPVLLKGTYSGLVLDVYVTNGPGIAGGIPIAPGASMDDGKLELLVIPNRDRVSRYVLLALAKFGWIRNRFVSRMFGVTASWIENETLFEAVTPTKAQTDGNLLNEPFNLAEVGVEPQRLRVLLPAR